MDQQKAGVSDPGLLFCSAEALFRERKVAEALALFEAAEQAGADPVKCAAYRWDCRMLLGDFAGAWRESDLIEQSGVPDPHRVWNRRPINGSRLILRCLHGLGDTIQFIRYAPLIRREARSLSVQAHPELLRILACVPGVDRAFSWEEDEGNWDQQIEINELPRLFRTGEQTIPTDIPYIHLPYEAQSRQNPRVGLVWASSAWNPARSLPLRFLLEALEGVACDLVTLQQGPEVFQAQELNVPPARPIPGDVLDTATDILNLDLVVSVDTLCAHLAGALGKPVWVLLPFEADWRWMLGRSDSPWYPTMRLFRQETPGDWIAPLTALREAALRF